MSFGTKILTPFMKFVRLMARPALVYYTLPWLMVLIVLGTVAQKEMGLYAATEKYFNSVILWLGPIPTPGGLTTIGVIFLALSCKFLFFSQWHWKKAGTHLTHLGVILLLLGGLITASMAREGFMVIPEGRSTNAMSDYQNRVLMLKDENGDPVQTLPFSTLTEGRVIDVGTAQIKVLEACANCSARAPSGKFKNLQGLAVNMELYTIPDEKNIEANFSGLIFELVRAEDTNILGTYIVMEDIPKNPVIDGLEISLERATEILPFDIGLKDFRKIDYPGTLKAREFESDLIVSDGNVSWPATISMNKPLRYKGYVFYQSSFEQRPDIEVTVLNVVHNVGRIFPYISTLVIFAGLLLHFIIRLQSSKASRGARG